MSQADWRKKWYIFYPLVFAGSFLIIVWRRPQAIFLPQFWAEDGRVWYAEAYNYGIIYSLTDSEAGYFQTISRLVALFAQAFPLEYAPLIFNLSAISIHALIAVFIVSSRTAHLVPKLRW